MKLLLGKETGLIVDGITLEVADINGARAQKIRRPKGKIGQIQIL